MNKILILLLLLSSALSAQNISVKVRGLENWRASLFSIELEKSIFIESITSDNKAQFIIQNNKLYNGFYRLVVDKNLWLNFVYDGKEIKIETNKNNLFDSLKVIKSEANKAYYKFLKLTSAYKTEHKKLQKAIAKYQGNDEHLIQTKKKFADIYDEYWTFVNKFSNPKNKSLIARYIQSAREPKIKSGLNIQAERKYLKAHFWDNVNFSNAALLHSDLYVNKTIDYLNYFGNSQIKKDLLEKEYQNAVDIILNKAKVNELTYQGMTEYLIKGFKKLGFGNVIDYIIDNFVIADDLCLDEQTENSIQMRIDQSKHFKKGITVPNIILPNIKGKEINLLDIEAKNKLILFYSSQCPHCYDFLPLLQQFYLNQKSKQFEVFAISLDTDRAEWLNFVRENKFSWVSISDLKGWKSKYTFEYYIYATPTMFLVNKNNILIGKPKNVDELAKLLKVNK